MPFTQDSGKPNVPTSWMTVGLLSVIVLIFSVSFLPKASATPFEEEAATIIPEPVSPTLVLPQEKSKSPKLPPGQLKNALKREAKHIKGKVAHSSEATVLLAQATTTDTTNPSDPTTVTATSSDLLRISATWTPSTDAESGIDYYAFGIGTVATGTYSELAGTRWWQVVREPQVSVALNLDPTQTYYFYVYAINGAGLQSNIATSEGIHPQHTLVGTGTNEITLAFSPVGYDIDGSEIASFSPELTAKMTAFFNKMYPILKNLYGAPAQNYTLTVTRDLYYSGSNIFIPSLDQIRMNDNFSPQLFTHELIHAFRNDYGLTMDQNWDYNSTLSGFEESFAQGVSYDAMNQYFKLYPNDGIVTGSLWDSSYEWDYDFQNLPILRGTNFWSDSGGTHLYWLRYEVGAAAIRKIQIEMPGFYQAFNQEYYKRLNADSTLRPSRALIVDIISSIVPTIEGQNSREWIDKQNIFYTQNVYGKKILNDLQDYPWNENFIAFQNIQFVETMPCGSEWACWDGTAWVYHHLNGSTGNATFLTATSSPFWTGTLLMSPTTNPPGTPQIGLDKLNITTASTNLPWPGGDASDYIFNVNQLGLYKFNATLHDPVSGEDVSDSWYRVMGHPMATNFFGVWGGVLNNATGTIYLNHEGMPEEPGIPVTNGAFAATRTWAGIPNSKTGYRDTIPGKIFVTFVNSDGDTYHAQRNIGYGSWQGGEAFLFDFPAPTVHDTIAPTVSLSGPSGSVSGITTITLTSSDNVSVSTTAITQDGVIVATSSASTLSYAWDTSKSPLGSHSFLGLAVDSSGLSATSSSLNLTVVDGAPPTASITSPVTGASLSGITTVTVTAADDRKVVRINLLLDNVNVATSTVSTLSYSWNTANSSLGSHTLKAVAYDTSGKASTNQGISVTVIDNVKPTVSITSPANNTTVAKSKTTSISATASDNRSIQKVEFYVGKVLTCTDTATPYTCNWNVPKNPNAKYSLDAVAYDGSGNSATSTIINVTSK